MNWDQLGLYLIYTAGALVVFGMIIDFWGEISSFGKAIKSKSLFSRRGE